MHHFTSVDAAKTSLCQFYSVFKMAEILFKHSLAEGRFSGSSFQHFSISSSQRESGFRQPSKSLGRPPSSTILKKASNANSVPAKACSPYHISHNNIPRL